MTDVEGVVIGQCGLRNMDHLPGIWSNIGLPLSFGVTHQIRVANCNQFYLNSNEIASISHKVLL